MAAEAGNPLKRSEVVKAAVRAVVSFRRRFDQRSRSDVLRWPSSAACQASRQSASSVVFFFRLAVSRTTLCRNAGARAQASTTLLRRKAMWCCGVYRAAATARLISNCSLHHRDPRTCCSKKNQRRPSLPGSVSRSSSWPPPTSLISTSASPGSSCFQSTTALFHLSRAPARSRPAGVMGVGSGRSNGTKKVSWVMLRCSRLEPTVWALLRAWPSRSSIVWTNLTWNP